MKQKSNIGLDKKQSEKLAEKLNLLLANYQIFYINARGFHWNISGNKFFELHLKFEEIYTDALVKIDEIAERVLTLGYTPFHSFTEYLKNATIKEAQHVSEGNKAVALLVEGLGTLLELERTVLAMAAEAGDEGTNALMSDYIREQEKLVWMFSAYLK
jgi:starvation-inducible DNA-binding protein